MENSFDRIKEVFKDEVDAKYYIPLNSHEKIKQDILELIFKEKMIILTGESGSGKSMILNVINNQLQNSLFIKNPYNVENLKKALNTNTILLIDEAHLLRDDIMERLRLRADEGKLNIVFAICHNKIDKILQKKHFQTRINSIVKLNNISLKETKDFIISKLEKNNFNQVNLKNSHFKKIYSFTKGSLRETNQLMFRVFDIMSYFYNKNIKISSKWIEMAIMYLKRKENYA